MTTGSYSRLRSKPLEILPEEPAPWLSKYAYIAVLAIFWPLTVLYLFNIHIPYLMASFWLRQGQALFDYAFDRSIILQTLLELWLVLCEVLILMASVMQHTSDKVRSIGLDGSRLRELPIWIVYVLRETYKAVQYRFRHTDYSSYAAYTSSRRRGGGNNPRTKGLPLRRASANAGRQRRYSASGGGANGAAAAPIGDDACGGMHMNNSGSHSHSDLVELVRYREIHGGDEREAPNGRGEGSRGGAGRGRGRMELESATTSSFQSGDKGEAVFSGWTDERRARSHLPKSATRGSSTRDTGRRTMYHKIPFHPFVATLRIWKFGVSARDGIIDGPTKAAIGRSGTTEDDVTTSSEGDTSISMPPAADQDGLQHVLARLRGEYYDADKYSPASFPSTPHSRSVVMHSCRERSDNTLFAARDALRMEIQVHRVELLRNCEAKTTPKAMAADVGAVGMGVEGSNAADPGEEAESVPSGQEQRRTLRILSRIMDSHTVETTLHNTEVGCLPTFDPRPVGTSANVALSCGNHCATYRPGRDWSGGMFRRNDGVVSMVDAGAAYGVGADVASTASGEALTAAATAEAVEADAWSTVGSTARGLTGIGGRLLIATTEQLLGSLVDRDLKGMVAGTVLGGRAKEGGDAAVAGAAATAPLLSALLDTTITVVESAIDVMPNAIQPMLHSVVDVVLPTKLSDAFGSTALERRRRKSAGLIMPPMPDKLPMPLFSSSRSMYPLPRATWVYIEYVVDFTHPSEMEARGRHWDGGTRVLAATATAAAAAATTAAAAVQPWGTIHPVVRAGRLHHDACVGPLGGINCDDVDVDVGVDGGDVDVGIDDDGRVMSVDYLPPHDEAALRYTRVSLGLAPPDCPLNTLVGVWPGSIGVTDSGDLLGSGMWCPESSTEDQDSKEEGRSRSSSSSPKKQAHQAVVVGMLLYVPEGDCSSQNVSGCMEGEYGVTPDVPSSSTSRSPPPSLMVRAKRASDQPVDTDDSMSTSSSIGGIDAATSSPEHAVLAVNCNGRLMQHDDADLMCDTLLRHSAPLYPTVSLSSEPSSAAHVWCRFHRDDLLDARRHGLLNREEIGAPRGVTVYSFDGSVLSFEDDE